MVCASITRRSQATRPPRRFIRNCGDGRRRSDEEAACRNITGSPRDLEALAVTTRNVRYLRHRFTTEIGPHFAMAYNSGGGLTIGADGEVISWSSPEATKLYTLYCEQGGQVMDEATGRHTGSWKWYREQIAPQVNLMRRAGGYHECYPRRDSASRLSGHLHLRTGSHSYGEYDWGAPSPGQYRAS